MFAQLGEMPKPISIKEYEQRQTRLYDTLNESDLLIRASPVTIHQTTSPPIERRVICYI